MAITRMSWGGMNTPSNNWKNNIGFLVDIGLLFRSSDRKIIIEKGSYVFGFIENNESYGYTIDINEELSLPNVPGNCYILMRDDGTFILVEGDKGSIRGLLSTAFPWFNLIINSNIYALVGKVFQLNGIVTGIISVDDPYWAEFEGEF